MACRRRAGDWQEPEFDGPGLSGLFGWFGLFGWMVEDVTGRWLSKIGQANVSFRRMKLPNGERAFVDVRKLRNYCFNAEHPRGQHKARVFRSALGWTAEKADDIRHRLLEAVLVEDTAFLGADDYGQRYAVDFPVQGLDAIVTIRSLWIIRHGEDFPRFTSCYVL